MAARPEQALAAALRQPRTERGTQRLLAMLRHDAPNFQGLSTADAEWLRGQLLGVIASRGAAEAAVPSMLEELRTSISPIVLAGAARTAKARGVTDATTLELLERAHQRISARDERVELAADGSASPGLTACQELDAAMRILRKGALGDRPTLAADSMIISSERRPCGFAHALLEDQDGRRKTFAGLARGHTTILTPFYVRCMNSEKCSATIVRLARLAGLIQREAQHGATRVLGLSYDPRHDIPGRLRQYGEARGFPFSSNARLTRCAKGWASIRTGLSLQAGYGDTTVNDHAREVFVIAPDLCFNRLDPELLSHPPELLAYATALSGSASA